MNTSEERSRLLVTGATGFLGQAIVAAARAAGHEVVAIGRSETSVPEGWASDAALVFRVLDLADDDAGAALAELQGGIAAVIHAAASMSGDDAVHARDTVGATATLIGAMTGGGSARLVLVSSIAVYGYAALPDWSTLDETAPVEPDPIKRDAYARAKLKQEALAIRAAQREGLDLRILRPGAIYGPGRTATGRLGFTKGGLLLTPGGDVPVPAIHVDHCAEALVRAATTPAGGWPDDVPILEGDGRVTIVNLVDPDPPSQSDWLAASGPRRVVRLPRRVMMKGAAMLELAGDLWPWLGRRIPSTLTPARLAARFKPLRYSTARAEDRLECKPRRGFADAMRSCLSTRDRTPEGESR